jgi:hypothetical protein
LANGQWDAIHRKIYTDSHAGSRRISSILKKIDNQSALNPHLEIHFHPSKSTTMATPPPSPLADKYTIAALQTAAHDSSTLYRPSCSGAVAALQFSASTKRRPSPQRSGDTH